MATPDPQHTPAPHRSQGTVLVVEDEDLVRSLAKIVLESEGLRVFAVSDGASAIQWLDEDQTIDFVLLDITLPDMSGREVLAHIQASRRGLPVILSSGYSPGEDPLPATSSFLKKPYGNADLRTHARAALANARRLQQP